MKEKTLKERNKKGKLEWQRVSESRDRKKKERENQEREEKR